MASLAQTDDTMSVGRVFSRGFGVIADNPVTVFGVAFVLGTLPSLVLNLAGRAIRTSPSGFSAASLDAYVVTGAVVVALVTLLIALALRALVQGSLVRATLAYTRGERATFGECISSSLGVVLPLIGLVIVMAICIGAGLILLIVPGVILYVIWSVASPALVAERTGVFGALSRSSELTKGARWKVFGVEVILLIINWIFSAALSGTLIATFGTDLTTLATTGVPVSWILVSAISGTLMNVLWSTVQASLYVELRNWKEGLPEQSLAEIFA